MAEPARTSLGDTGAYALELDGVGRRFGALTALADVTMSIKAGAEPPHKGGMSPDQARSILGVGPQASADEIQAAYLRLIRRNHPDQGGSSGLAAQLNAARDVLLGKG